MPEELQSVRIPKDSVEKVRTTVKTSRHTIGGFIALAIDEKIQRMKEEDKKKKER